MVKLDPDYLDSLAKAAYDAYCGERNWKSFNGDPLPQWDGVREDIKTGWRKSAAAVINIHHG